jgi:hypothetical protein
LLRPGASEAEATVIPAHFGLRHGGAARQAGMDECGAPGPTDTGSAAVGSGSHPAALLGAGLEPGSNAAAVEAAALAVVRAAAAVEAAAATVHTAAAAIDLAAATMGRAAHPGAGMAAPVAPAAPLPVALALAPAPMIAPAPLITPAPQVRPGAVRASDPRRRFRRVAIIHYWLVTMRGGERVLERLLELFPEADVFTHVYDPAAMSDAIRSRTVRTSFIQRLPGARRHYQAYLPLMPMALEQLDLRGYDLVISSESGPAKGVIPAPDALHLCYVHSPMRYLWDHYHQYRDEAGWLKRAGPTIRMIPRLDFAALRRAYARCRALVFTAEEDFGIVPVEVMASGRPVLAYGRGGALDSVVAERTGLFFAEQTTEALIDAVRRLEHWLPQFDPAEAMARAQDFAPDRFDAGVLEALA